MRSTRKVIVRIVRKNLEHPRWKFVYVAVTANVGEICGSSNSAKTFVLIIHVRLFDLSFDVPFPKMWISHADGLKSWWGGKGGPLTRIVYSLLVRDAFRHSHRCLGSHCCYSAHVRLSSTSFATMVPIRKLCDGCQDRALFDVSV